MTYQNQLFFIHCLSPVHVGAGQGIGIIDMPIIRERVTEWPYVPGSTSKGVFREKKRRENDEEWVKSAFGVRLDATNEEQKGNAGALVFSDAKMLAFPVASGSGVFAYATCPLALERMQQECAALGLTVPHIVGLEQLTEEEAWVAHDNTSVLPGSFNSDKIVLEQFEFEVGRKEAVSVLAKWLTEHLKGTEQASPVIEQRLCIVSNEAFQYFVTMCCEIEPRIRLQEETKTAAEGALWHEEYIPAEAILYGTLWGDQIYRANAETSTEELLQKMRGVHTVQIGGNVSVGKGLVKYHMGGAIRT